MTITSKLILVIKDDLALQQVVKLRYTNLQEAKLLNFEGCSFDYHYRDIEDDRLLDGFIIACSVDADLPLSNHNSNVYNCGSMIEGRTWLTRSRLMRSESD